MLAECDVQLAKSNENETNSFSVCVDKIVCQSSNISSFITFLKAHFGYLENSVDPDQPDFSSRLCYVVNLERANCIHLLKIATDGNFNLLFWKKTTSM